MLRRLIIIRVLICRGVFDSFPTVAVGSIVVQIIFGLRRNPILPQIPRKIIKRIGRRLDRQRAYDDTGQNYGADDQNINFS